jgi:hypothetical protein
VSSHEAWGGFKPGCGVLLGQPEIRPRGHRRYPGRSLTPFDALAPLACSGCRLDKQSHTPGTSIIVRNHEGVPAVGGTRGAPSRLPGTDRQHRTTCVTHHAICCAAKQHVLHPAVSVGGHHNHIYAAFLCFAQDLLMGISGPDNPR